MMPDIAQGGYSAIVFDECSRLAWEYVISQHPDHAVELEFVWGMVQRAAQHVLEDPDLAAELERRVQQTAREITDENYGYTGAGTGDPED